MKKLALAALLALSVPAQADSIRDLISDTTGQPTSVYSIKWVKDGKSGHARYNAHSLNQALFSIKSQLKIADNDIVSIEIEQQVAKSDKQTITIIELSDTY